MAPRKRDEQARDRILDAALSLFAQHGFHGVGVDAIAAAAKLSPASLYNHFPSKQDLFRALIEREIPPGFVWQSPTDAPLRTLLTEAAFTLVRWFREKPELNRLLVAEAVRDPAVGAVLYGHVLSITSRLTGVLEERAARGEIAVPSAEAASRFFLGAVAWAETVLEVFGGRQVEPVDDSLMVDLYVTMFLSALQGGNRP